MAPSNSIHRLWFLIFLICMVQYSQARVKLVALPERGKTIIRLDNAQATLIEEERVLTLQKGTNLIDFSWNGVEIVPDTIRLQILSHPKEVRLINVSYPPKEAALVWEIFAEDAYEEQVRISYLLRNIDRLIEYDGLVNKEENSINLRSYIILRNFSGEDFEKANIVLDYGQAFEQGTRHEETRRLLFFKADQLPLEKVWTFDARSMPWDPEREATNVGIPVGYRIFNTPEKGLGKFRLWDGKVRVYQEDGRGSTIFSGEDRVSLVPIGEKMQIGIGQSRDIVVTQRKTSEKQTNIRRDNNGNIVLYDLEVAWTVKIENFKDKPAVLTLIEQIPGHWEMKSCNAEYKREDFQTIKFEIQLKPQEKREVLIQYIQRNVPTQFEEIVPRRWEE